MEDRFDAEFENVLLVSIDCLRADALRRGIDEGLVPTLGGLVKEGISFENAFTVANTTDPSLTSFMTATYPNTHGVQQNGWGLDESIPVLAELLRKDGVDTFGVVSVDHLSNEHSGLGRGFDAYRDGGNSYDTLYPILSRVYDTRAFNAVFGAVKDLGTERWNLKSLLRRTGLIRLHCRTAESVTADAVDELNRVEPPFFGWVHYFDMHEPRNFDYAALSDHDEYTASMLLIDEYVESLLEVLSELSLRTETLVVLTADHGESLGDHGYTGHGRQLYDEEIHVPLTFHHCGVRSESVADQVRTIDIAPTVLDMFGVPAPDSFEGESLLVPATGGMESDDQGGGSGGNGEHPPVDRDVFLTAYPEFTESVGLRTPRWKLIREDGACELYDLVADPDEENDLVAIGGTRETPYDELKMRLDAWNSKEIEEQDIDDETQEMLADLGYVD